MKIIADENMPKVRELFSAYGDVTLVNGRTLTKTQLIDADVLLVRSVTQVNKALLEGTPIKFVGTATIGVDHIDQDFLVSQDIGFASAPGCNAEAVADYIVSALCYLYTNKGVRWLNKTIGIIGFGNVGRTVYQRLSAVGCHLKVYDPHQSQVMATIPFVSLEEIMDVDILCLHAPLIRDGDFPSFHMLDKAMLSLLKAGTSIISAGRGGVIDEACLLERYRVLKGALHLVWDVWEGEPNLSSDVLDIVDIATPHIAGYSKQGREKGTLMIFKEFQHFFADYLTSDDQCFVSKGMISSIECNKDSDDHDIIASAVRSIYDVMRDDSYMRAAYKATYANEGYPFDRLRKQYIERDELNTCQTNNPLLMSLGFSSSK